MEAWPSLSVFVITLPTPLTEKSLKVSISHAFAIFTEA